MLARSLFLAPLALLILACGAESETPSFPNAAASTSAAPPQAQQASESPAPPREFRAAWVATVANIDWPSKPGLPVAQMRSEAIAILDRLVELRMNAVIFQVRPHADALYPSKLEPWSWYLTGQQGQAPAGGFDPLAFWLKEAHARGLELHAWFNPYRAGHPAMKGPHSQDSIVRKRPGLVVKLGDQGYYWMDPALKDVQDHSIRVMLDVVKRYDVDGIHLDDYFYPYESYNKGKDFPDDASYARYRKAGGKLERKDFRRAAVNGFVRRLYKELRATKKPVKFGISPFGIWRPGHPRGIAGMDQYDKLYADARLWLREGWVDYWTPQLYWPTTRLGQSFPLLLGWWKDQNIQGRHLWPGVMPRGGKTNAESATEMLTQLMITRGIVRENPGLVLFSMKQLMGTDSLVAKELRKAWREDALLPASPWLDSRAPGAPRVAAKEDGKRLLVGWRAPADKDVARYVVHLRRDKSWSWRVLPAAETSFVEPDSSKLDELLVSAVDRAGNEGPRVRAWQRRP
jgi:uncharacterized lipoprotein YddW (UPF0748 family)